MILGIGTDIVEVARMDDMLARRGDAFPARVLCRDEFEEFRSHQAPARYLAKRFAAKEALLKALGTGLRDGIRWPDIRVHHDSLGRPLLLLAGEALSRFGKMGATGTHISLSDEASYAVAFVIVERS